jgi:hypothetical protein
MALGAGIAQRSFSVCNNDMLFKLEPSLVFGHFMFLQEHWIFKNYLNMKRGTQNLTLLWRRNCCNWNTDLCMKTWISISSGSNQNYKVCEDREQHACRERQLLSKESPYNLF